MSVHNIDVVKIQTLQGCAKTFDDVLSRQAVVVDQNFTIRSSWNLLVDLKF
jgi:hypothetical protein